MCPHAFAIARPPSCSLHPQDPEASNPCAMLSFPSQCGCSSMLNTMSSAHTYSRPLQTAISTLPCCIQIGRWQESCWKPQRGALTWLGGLGGCYAGSGLQQVLQRIAGCCGGCSSTCCASCSWRCLRHCSKSEFFRQRPQCATEQQQHWQGLMLARFLQTGHRCFEATHTSRS